MLVPLTAEEKAPVYFPEAPGYRYETDAELRARILANLGPNRDRPGS